MKTLHPCNQTMSLSRNPGRVMRRGMLPALAALAIPLACDRPANPAVSPLNARIDSLVAESMQDGKVPGLALSIVRDDSLVHSKGYGFADLEGQRPMSDTTPVVIGSTSKTFTAFAVMQLAEDGRLALDSSVTRYVAILGAPGREQADAPRIAPPRDPRFSRITLRHLLTNSAGIPAGFSGDPYDAVDTSAYALERIVRDDMLPRPLDFDPGTSYRYSNRGFSLASLVVQDVAGESYEDVIARRIFLPLGMTQSTGRFWEGAARGMVQGYREAVNGRPVPRPASLGREWTGSGMILSTSRDAARFLRAMLTGGTAPDGTRVLSAAGVAEILRPQREAESELGGPTRYGLGWEVSEQDGVTMITKGGSVGTMGSLFVLLPAQRVGIALVFNDIDYGKVQLLQNLVKLLLDAPTAPYASAPPPPVVPPGSHRLSAERARDVAGDYDTRNGIMRIAARGDTLRARFEGNDLSLEPTSDTSFVMRSALREQEGTALVIKPCGTTMCLWMRGDSSGVRR